jgi:peptide/nickel transport system ATP-binding protein
VTIAAEAAARSHPRAGQPVLEVADLSVQFPSESGPVHAVRNITYQVMPGEVLGIVGESGSGKSVSSLAVMGLLPASALVTGSVRFQGQELLGRPDKELSHIRGRKISMIFQDPLSALTPVYTVGDQLAEAILVHHDLSKDAAGKRAVELLDLVGIPNPKVRATAFPHEFSGGMRQRAMIAMAIANDPDLIIADEPTTALDVTIQAQILEVLHTARDTTGAAIIMITHDLGVVAGFADRITVMYAGKPVESGSVDEVFYRPRMPYTMGLLGSIPRLDMGERQPLTPIEGSPPSLVNLPTGCPFVPRCPMRVEVCSEVEPALLRVGSGEPATGAVGEHTAACHRSDEIERLGLTSVDVFPAQTPPETAVARVPRTQRPAVLEVDGLVRHFPLVKGAVFRRRVGTVQAVNGISLDVREGETLGLVGESGCGKTTTLMEVLNLVKPQAGRIVVLGRDTAAMSGSARFAIRRDLQVVFQDPMASLDPRLPLGDILAEPLATHGVPGPERARRVRELLRLVGLRPEHANRYPHEFSGGQRQRVGIARALALQPKVLVLDEPVSALDVSIRAGVINLLEQLRADLGLAYLFVAHDLSVVRHIADRVAVMYLGTIAEIGEVDRVFEQPSHPYTQALLSAIPIPDPEKERQRRRIVLQGDLPSPADPPSGCPFRTRCQKFAAQLIDAERQLCVAEAPSLRRQGGGDADHRAACHYAEAYDVL